jgi:hypothetical protein
VLLHVSGEKQKTPSDNRPQVETLGPPMPVPSAAEGVEATESSELSLGLAPTPRDNALESPPPLQEFIDEQVRAGISEVDVLDTVDLFRQLCPRGTFPNSTCTQDDTPVQLSGTECVATQSGGDSTCTRDGTLLQLSGTYIATLGSHRTATTTK